MLQSPQFFVKYENIGFEKHFDKDLTLNEQIQSAGLTST